MISRAIPLLLVSLLLSCSPGQDDPEERLMPNRPFGDMVGDTITGTAEGAWSAVESPFVDVNLKQEEIPPKLLQVMQAPYALPTPAPGCAALRAEISELTALLGTDEGDTATTTTAEGSRRGEYLDEGANMASDQAVGLVKSHVSILPFRSMVRKISGADRHAKRVARAYQAGKLRRAFLKGLAASQPGCL